jgi:hypothetical protein
LSTDASLLDKVAKNAKSVVHEKFNIENIASDYLVLWKEME